MDTSSSPAAAAGRAICVRSDPPWKAQIDQDLSPDLVASHTSSMPVDRVDPLVSAGGSGRESGREILFLRPLCTFVLPTGVARKR
jgi:hypothetical protein